VSTTSSSMVSAVDCFASILAFPFPSDGADAELSHVTLAELSEYSNVPDKFKPSGSSEKYDLLSYALVPCLSVLAS